MELPPLPSSFAVRRMTESIRHSPERGAGLEVVPVGLFGEGGPAGGLFRVGSDAGGTLVVEFREELGGSGFAEFSGVGEPTDGGVWIRLGGEELERIDPQTVGG